MCARLSSLIDNHDLCATMTAKMDPGQCCSPKTTGLPREYFEVNKPAYYYVPGQSPQLNTITYRTATTAESSLSYPTPRQAAIAFSLNPTTGQITWTPNTIGLYAYQVRVLDGFSEIPLDFLMEGAFARSLAFILLSQQLTLSVLPCSAGLVQRQPGLQQPACLRAGHPEHSCDRVPRCAKVLHHPVYRSQRWRHDNWFELLSACRRPWLIVSFVVRSANVCAA
jgi:hypothetical protein